MPQYKSIYIFALIASVMVTNLPRSFAAGDVDPAAPPSAESDQQSSRQPPEDSLVISLGDDILIKLPANPVDESQRAQFDLLTAAEKQSFYNKRRFLITKMVQGLTKPGVGSAIRWTKNKVKAGINLTKSILKRPEPIVEQIVSRNSEASEVEEIEPTPQEFSSENFWLDSPAKLSDPAKALIEQTVTAYVANFWDHSASIARSNGIGLTAVGGVIWNTTLGNFGKIYGRSISFDLGMDFAKQEGYFRVVWDKQSKKQGGVSFDVGFMADLMLHITDPDLSRGETMNASHTKLPVVGCFRSAPNYNAWGAQLGLSIVEATAIVAKAFGLSGYGTMSSAIIAMRSIGMATVYQTNLDRTVLYSTKLNPKSRVLKWLGLGSSLSQARGSAMTCEQAFN